MAANKNVRFNLVALTTTYGTNILNPTVTSMAGPVGITISQPYFIVKHIRIVNKGAAATTFRLFVGLTAGTAAGTEFMGFDTNVPIGSFVEWFGNLRLDAADFLSGGASLTTQLTFEAEGEIGISG
jgi:hypothetical protein